MSPRSTDQWAERSLAILESGGWKTLRRDTRGAGSPLRLDLWERGGPAHVYLDPEARDLGYDPAEIPVDLRHGKALEGLRDQQLEALRDAGAVTLEALARRMYGGRKLTAKQRSSFAEGALGLADTGTITYRMQPGYVELWSDLYNLRGGRGAMLPRGMEGGEGRGGQRKRALAVTLRAGSRYYDEDEIRLQFLEDVIVRYLRSGNEAVPGEALAEAVSLSGRDVVRKRWSSWQPRDPDAKSARKWVLEQINTAVGAERAKKESREGGRLLSGGGLKPNWVVTSTDARGKSTERVWGLPGLGPWSRHAVFDLAPGFRRGGQRYAIYFREQDGAYRDTGVHFATQRALLEWMAANPPKVVSS